MHLAQQPIREGKFSLETLQAMTHRCNVSRHFGDVFNRYTRALTELVSQQIAQTRRGSLDLG